MISTTNIFAGIIAIIGIGFFLSAIFGMENYGSKNLALEKNQQNFQQFTNAELPDKCKTPPGYSDTDWKEHMGHHPERYTECL